MGIRGQCPCGNFTVTWHTNDLSLVPRACQCDYCAGRNATWVSKSGTRFEVLVHNDARHRCIQHGSRSANFHECSHCDEVIVVTAEIDGDLYGVLNANHLENKLGFPPPVPMDCGGQGEQEKRARWQLNWCGPVKIRPATGL